MAGLFRITTGDGLPVVAGRVVLTLGHKSPQGLTGRNVWEEWKFQDDSEAYVPDP